MRRMHPTGRYITGKLPIGGLGQAVAHLRLPSGQRPRSEKDERPSPKKKTPTARQRLLRIGASPFLLGCPSLTKELGKLANVDQNRLSYCPASSEFDLTTALVKQTIDFGVSMEASTDASIASSSIAVVPLSIALASSHPLAKQESCSLGDLKDALFCLPCADRFPSLTQALWAEIEEKVKGALAVDFHSNMEDLNLNAACGACCPCFYTEIDSQKKQTSLIDVEDAAPLSLFLIWRKNSAASQLIDLLVNTTGTIQY